MGCAPDLLESKKLVLDDVFSCRAQGTVTLARKLITKIAEVHEAARAGHEGVQQHEPAAAALAEEKVAADAAAKAKEAEAKAAAAEQKAKQAEAKEQAKQAAAQKV